MFVALLPVLCGAAEPTIGELRQAAEQGDAAARCDLGVRLLHGSGVDRDMEEGVKWILASAEDGHPAGRTWLGRLYREGLVVPFDADAAFRESLEAAGDDYPAAQFAVAECYRLGIGTLPQHEKGDLWYKRAAAATTAPPESVDAASALAVGLCLRDGWGVERNYRRAARWLLQAARRNHPQALLELSNFYTYGFGVTADATKAAAIMKKAAEAGSAHACLAFARMLRDGTGIERDEQASREWARKGREHLVARAGLGSVVAATDLYQFLYDGRLGQPQPAIALKWLTTAARKQYGPALMHLGRHLMTGDGLARDPDTAITLLERAADLHDSEANYVLWQVYRSGDAGEPDMDRALLALQQAAALGNITAMHTLADWFRRYSNDPTADAQADYWYREALGGYERLAERGNVDAMAALVTLYGRGRGTERDIDAALSWLRKAAENGWAKAQYMMANACEKGLGRAADRAEALAWYTRSAENGYVPAMLTLGAALEQGALAEEPDPAGAERWYAQAYTETLESANQGLPDARYFLSSLIMNGIGTPQDPSRAIAMLKQAAEAGHGPAQLDLGTMYQQGDHVEADNAEARRWIEMAAEGGSADAQFMLGRAYDTGLLGERDYVEAFAWFHLAAMQEHRLAATMRDELAVTLSNEEIEEGVKRARSRQERTPSFLPRGGVSGGSAFTPPTM